MATTIKENNEKPLFELKEFHYDKLVFKRVVKDQGKSKKIIQKIVDELPTATVHVMSEENFQRLKKIEKELNTKIVSAKGKNSMKDLIFKFLEI